MKKKKNWKPQYRKFVRQLVGELQYRMFLTLYSIDINYAQDEKAEKKADDKCVGADIKTDNRYYTGYITLYPVTHLLWDVGKKRELAEVVVHEMCHILTDPLYKIAIDAINNSNQKFIEDIREQTTQHICNMVMASLEKEKPHLIGI